MLVEQVAGVGENVAAHFAQRRHCEGERTDSVEQRLAEAAGIDQVGKAGASGEHEAKAAGERLEEVAAGHQVFEDPLLREGEGIHAGDDERAGIAEQERRGEHLDDPVRLELLGVAHHDGAVAEDGNIRQIAREELKRTARFALEQEHSVKIAHSPKAMREFAERLGLAEEVARCVCEVAVRGFGGRDGGAGAEQRSRVAVAGGREGFVRATAGPRRIARAGVAEDLVDFFEQRLWVERLVKDAGRALAPELVGEFQGEGPRDEDHPDFRQNLAQCVHELLAVHARQIVIDDGEIVGAFPRGGERRVRVLVGRDRIAGLAQEKPLHFQTVGGILHDKEMRPRGLVEAVAHQAFGPKR